MTSLQQRLRSSPWGLTKARTIAVEIVSSKALIRTLIRKLFGNDIEIRKRAADVGRRITECSPESLEPYADELAGLLESIPPEESRTRWHLGLVLPRIAHTPLHRARAARIMLLLAADQSSVVRCSAVEGLATLALVDRLYLNDAEEMADRFLQDGTPAMKSRARHVKKLLLQAYGER